MATQEIDAQTKARVEARKLLDEAWERSQKAYKEVKNQADIVYKKAKKLAVDKQAKQELDRTHKETLEQAKKVRDAIMVEAQAVFTGTWDQGDKDYDEAIAKSKKISVQAQKAYDDTKHQADMIHKEAKKLAVDKQAKQEADRVHEEALRQAEKNHKEATDKSL
ncbi:hypothetical protein ACFLTP_05360 [Chloroflexota bacterium]